MEAQFDSVCDTCGEDIYEGDEIILDDGEWVHEACATVEDDTAGDAWSV
jgi:hypothetical protein